MHIDNFHHYSQYKKSVSLQMQCIKLKITFLRHSQYLFGLIWAVHQRLGYLWGNQWRENSPTKITPCMCHNHATLKTNSAQRGQQGGTNSTARENFQWPINMTQLQYLVVSRALIFLSNWHQQQSRNNLLSASKQSLFATTVNKARCVLIKETCVRQRTAPSSQCRPDWMGQTSVKPSALEKWPFWLLMQWGHFS